VIFFVDPNEEVLLIVVPDTSRVGPVSGHSSGGKEGRNWFVKEEVVSDELVLVLFGHVGKTVVLALELTIELGKSFTGGGFDLSSLGASAPWRKSVTSDRSASSDSSGRNVVGVKGGVHLDLGRIEVGLVLVSLLVAVVAGFDDGIEKVGEDFVGLFVASNGTDGHDEGMAGVVDTGLDDMIDSEARWSLLLSQILVKIKSEHVSHVVVVLLEVGEILLAGKSSRVQVWHLAFSDSL